MAELCPARMGCGRRRNLIPTTHLVATVDDLTDMLDFGSEDLDGMDNEYGDEPEPAPTGHWISTTHNDVLMVDTPENIDNEENIDVLKVAT